MKFLLIHTDGYEIKVSKFMTKKEAFEQMCKEFYTWSNVNVEHNFPEEQAMENLGYNDASINVLGMDVHIWKIVKI